MPNFRIELKDFVGKYLPRYISDEHFRMVDNGISLKTWLVGEGYVVVDHGEAERHSFAKTECGFYISSSGYVCEIRSIYNLKRNIIYFYNHSIDSAGKELFGIDKSEFVKNEDYEIYIDDVFQGVFTWVSTENNWCWNY